MVKSRTESPETRRKQILDATRKLLSQKGYQDIKLDDVAAKSGLAKGTLYLHFKDKEQIVRAVFETLMDRLEEKLANVGEAGDVSHLKRIAIVKLEFFHENRDFFSEFMHLKESLSSPNRSGVEKRFKKHMDLMMTYIERAMHNGHLPQGDLFLTTFFYMSLIRMFWIKDQIAGRKLNSKANKNFQSEVDTLIDLFLHGIQKGIKGKK